jgi:hypothetical protein
VAVQETAENPRGWSSLDLAAQFIPATLFMTLMATFAAALFSALFAAGTQLALIWTYTRVRYPEVLVHIALSAGLGAALFPTLSPWVERLQGTDEILATVVTHDHAFAIVVGALGGAAVGFLWNQLLLTRLYRSRGTAP